LPDLVIVLMACVTSRRGVLAYIKNKIHSRQKRKTDRVPRRSKHLLLTGHTRREPVVEITYAGFPIIKGSNDSLTKGMKQIIQQMTQT
jgi:hypothetical protein